MEVDGVSYNVWISIHALLAESDAVHFVGLSALAPISIHALLAESDLSALAPEENPTQFLSTLSLRRATVNGGALSSYFDNFYPRSPCGERHS